MENNNQIEFDENKPYVAPHNPFTLEGHWFLISLYFGCVKGVS